MRYETVEVEGNLRLVQVRPDQADRLFELTDNNREYLGRFLPWVPYVKTVEDSQKHIAETIENRANGKIYTYGIEYDGEIVGDISLRNLQDESQAPEIGYWISPDYSGKGLTTKAVRALTDLAIGKMGLHKIAIRANPENIASNKVAEKAGYTLVGHEVEHDEPLNVWAIRSELGLNEV